MILMRLSNQLGAKTKGFQLDLGNSDVWAMQCFCSVVSKMVSEHDRRACPETSLESKHLNYQGLMHTQRFLLHSSYCFVFLNFIFGRICEKERALELKR